MAVGMSVEEASAKRFVAELERYQSDEELEKIQRYFKTDAGEYGEGDQFMGVRMGQVFELAKRYIEMPPSEIEKLLESPIHEVRAGGVSIMDKQARRKRTPEVRRRELYELYLRRLDRINNWDSSISAPRSWSAATCASDRATSSASSPVRRTSGSAERPSTRLPTSSARARPTRSRSPRSFWRTRRT